MYNRYLIKLNKRKHNKRKPILKYGQEKNLKHYLRNYLKVYKIINYYKGF